MGNSVSKDESINYPLQKTRSNSKQTESVKFNKLSFNPSIKRLSGKTVSVRPVRHQLVTADHITPLVPLSSVIYPLGSNQDNQSMSSIASDEIEPNTPTISTFNESTHHDMWMYEYGAEKELDRQTRQHYILKQVFQGNIHVKLNEPKKILESACGVGLWSLETAHDYPTCQVIGMNILPSFEKENLSFAKSSINAGQAENICFQQGNLLTTPLSFSNNTFDFIYQRDVATILPFKLWPNLINEFYRITKQGGKIELVEYDLLFKRPGPVLDRINNWYSAAAATIGVRQGYTSHLYEYLQQAGYINIVEQTIDIPIGEWPTDQLQKQYGYLYKEQIKALFKSMKRWWCTEIKVTPEEYDQVCADALPEFEKYNSFCQWKIFTAEKPLDTVI
ncbi:hypothetical protein G6F62_004382 [Rhizopus arrhizus]|nr:hypothetical protein G6F62_004382 [Rhizopus arrhizus]KAG1374196.1 hypothetical protein G6F61_009538 [Rhizopus arrhizus]